MSTASLDHLSMDPAVALRAIIELAIFDHPRSAQAEIGASEIGTPCTRKLGFKLSGTPAARPPEAAWRPTVGTAVHTWLEAAIVAENARLGWDRWLTEHTVTVGEYGGAKPLGGHCDLYDRLTKTVIDWKVGKTALDKAKKNRHPGETYRVQAHCYGMGFANTGEEVKTVAVMFLPPSGELGDRFYWSEPYDESIALAALQRARTLNQTAAAIGWPALIPNLPKVEDYCTRCEWFAAGTADTSATTCTGALPQRPGKEFDPRAAFGRVTNK